MTGPVVYAVPYIPPAPFADPWPGITQLWIGPDGSEWALGGKGAQGIHLKPGVRGRTMPEGKHTIDQPAGIAGGVWRGWRADPREVFWPLSVWKDGGSQAWLDYDSAFAASFDPERPGTWVVIQPNGTRRELRCRFVSDGGGAGDFAPGVRGYASYGITMIAEEPYWRGEQVVRWFTPAEPVDFLPAHAGDPFVIGEGSSTATARVSNLGDVTAWPTWWANGTDTVTAGVGDMAVEIPFTVAPDRLLVVDTSPAVRTAIEIDMYPTTTPPYGVEAQEKWVAERLPTGLDRTRELGENTKFAAIPRGKSLNLAIDIVGSGRVRVAFAPQHRRAW